MTAGCIWRYGLAQVIITTLPFSAAPSGTSFWLAAGTYKPSACTVCDAPQRALSFSVASGVALYGGFAGNETDLARRDINRYPATLSGDIGLPGSNTDNSLHVVTITAATPQTRLDGLIIRDGNAGNEDGGGLLIEAAAAESSPTVVQCRFIDNRARQGGALCARAAGVRNPVASATFSDCEFTGNAAALGGAYYGEQAQARLTPGFVRCRFRANTSAVNGGAVGLFSQDTQASRGLNEPVFVSCLFSANTAANVGGALYTHNYSEYGGRGDSRAILINCTLSGNTARAAGGAGGTGIASVYTHGSSLGPGPVSITSCILWNNSGGSFFPVQTARGEGITYSLIEEGAACAGNSSSNPRFADPAAGDYWLTECSPAVDAGTTAPLSGETTDLAGQPRLAGRQVDMGAYELQTPPTNDVMVTVRDGNWNDPTVWSCTRIPVVSDTVKVRHTIIIPAAYKGQVKHIQYDPSGRLVFSTGSILQTGF
nr:choice-of-anchor Q domain-containing protein [uncultured Arsenicibacter sp.]